MERVAVNSSMISSIGFDGVTMEVEFKVAEGKPPSIYLVQEAIPTGELAMLHSAMMVPDASVGQIYNSRIRPNQNFVITKVEDAA
jgi:hypothetical protein